MLRIFIFQNTNYLNLKQKKFLHKPNTLSDLQITLKRIEQSEKIASHYETICSEIYNWNPTHEEQYKVFSSLDPDIIVSMIF